MFVSKKETGENPVRARRRKACKKFFLLFAAKRGQAIGVAPEKAKKFSAKSKHFLDIYLLLRAPIRKGKNIKFLGECKL